jgi:spore coat polysaccharide biosynthesis protein SpsF (cytidylyltransferase family)
MNVGIVICSRKNSSRIHEKPFQDIEGTPLIERLIQTLMKTKLKIILAVPTNESKFYESLKIRYGISFHVSHSEDPLRRIDAAANEFNLDTVIRVCHDKIFVEPELIFKALEQFDRRQLDYLYSDQFTDGTAFEIISSKSLSDAARKYSCVEHVSYAIKSITKNQALFEVPPEFKTDLRLLVDYPEDLTLIKFLFRSIEEPDLHKIIRFYDNHKWIKNLNRLPEVTIYTCAYNADRWLSKCIDSVRTQNNFERCEYILVDDGSTDDTNKIMLKYSSMYPNIKIITNKENIGLSSSCNKALKEARGKYLIRIDADDYFFNHFSVFGLQAEIERTNKDVVYPNNFYGSLDKVQKGKEQHHVGGAIFKTRAVNHIKFTDKLMNLEGLDFFERAKNQLSIGYLNVATFFYRQTSNSMSKINLVEREQTKKLIMDKML